MKKITGRKLLLLTFLAAIFSNVNYLYASDFGSATGPGIDQDKEEEPEDTPENCGTDGNGGAGANGSQSSRGGSASGGDPVNFYSGREKLRVQDIKINSVYPINFVRNYDSHSTYDSPVGFGWSHNHDRRLYEYPDNSVLIRHSCGNKNKLIFTGGAYVSSNTNLQGDLVELGSGTYEFTYLNGTKDYYDEQGRLTAAEDVIGNRLEYSYSATKVAIVGISPFAVDPNKPTTVALSFQLTKIEERLANGTLSGIFIDLTYDPDTGRLAQITSNDGRTINYEHDVVSDGMGNNLTSGNLLNVSGLEGIVSTYQYADPNDIHNLTYIQKGAGTEPYVNTYDTKDRVIKQIYGDYEFSVTYTIPYFETRVVETIRDSQGNNPVNITTKYKFNTDGYTTDVENGEGQLVKFTLNNMNLIEREEYFSQEINGVRELVKAIDYEFNSEGKRVTQTVVLDSNETVTKTWTYTGAWLQSEEVVSSERPTEIFRKEYTFFNDVSGNPININEERLQRSNGSYQITSYAYNNLNQITSINYASGIKKKFEYLNGSRFATKVHWETVTGQPIVAREVQYAYDSEGNVASVTDAKQHTSTFEYDDLGRLVKIVNALAEESIYTYVEGNLTEIEIGRVYPGGILESGRKILFEYDGKNQIQAIKKYDAQENILLKESFKYDSKGRQTSHINGENKEYKFSYDSRDLLVQISDPNNNSTLYTYDVAGRKVQEKDALNRVTEFVFDDLDRLVQKNELGVSLSVPITTSLQYDANSNLISITDSKNNTTSYGYDRLSRRITETKPLNEQTQFDYDEFDRIIEVISAKGEKLQLEYYEWGGIKNKFFYSSVSDVTVDRTQSYQYDLNGNTTQISDTDVSLSPLYTNSYDELNRIISSVTHYIPGGSRSFAYEYNRFGDLVGRIFNDGSNQIGYVYDYDTQGRISGSIVDNNIFSFSHDNADQLVTIDYPNNLSTEYGYESSGVIDSISFVDSSNTAFESLSYTYDAVKNIKTYIDNNETFSYDYDELDRLIDANYPVNAFYPPSEEFDYDSVGNREDAIDPNVFTYNQNNQLTSTESGGVVFQYDNNGNLEQKSLVNTPASLQNFGYDLNGRLITFTKNTVSVNYSYDPFGRRISKEVNGNRIWYLWEENKIVAEYSESSGVSQLVQRYDFIPGSSDLLQMKDVNGLYFSHNDNYGTSKVLTNINSEVVWRNQRKAFGEAQPNQDVDSNNVEVTLNLRFPGQYFDQETGLYYNYFRNYDPTLGRYVQSDPIGLDGGINTYGYVLQNPLKYSDPYGLATTVDTWCGRNPVACAQSLGRGRSSSSAIPQASTSAGGGDGDDCECQSNIPRSTAQAMAYAFAGLPQNGSGTNSIPWNNYNPPSGAGRGTQAFAETMQYLSTNGVKGYGASLPSGAEVVEHPQGHPDIPGPEHHKCPHFHARSASGHSQVYVYKPGS